MKKALFLSALPAVAGRSGRFFSGLVPLECDAGCPVRYMDDSAAAEAVFCQQVLHHFVVGVRIGAKAGKLFGAPLDAGCGNPLAASVRSHAVNHVIGLVIGPRALLYMRIGRVGAWNETERPDRPALFILAHMAV